MDRTTVTLEAEVFPFGAIGVHHTGTTDQTWDGPANEARLSNDAGASTYRRAFAWVNSSKDADTKAAYSFIHHQVGTDGSVGAANTTACSTGIGVLNGGRGVSGADWSGDKQGIWRHLAAHLRDSGVKAADVPKLKGASVAEQEAMDLWLERYGAWSELREAAGCQSTPCGADGLPLGPAGNADIVTTTNLLIPNTTATVTTSFPITEAELPERIGHLRARQQGMTAAGPDMPQIVENSGAEWHAILCVEGLRTDEDPGREIVPGACQFPDLPVSLRLQIEDEGGHWGVVTCGRIDTMERQGLDGYNAIYATGVFGTDENGQRAQLLVEEQTQRFISIDPRDCDLEIVEVEIATNSTPVGGYGPIGIVGMDGEEDEQEPSGCLQDWWVRYTSLTIGAATIVAQPALQQAVITLASVPLPETPVAVDKAPPSQYPGMPGMPGMPNMTASGEESADPPRQWFEWPGFYVGDPRLVRQADGHHACPLTVEGRRVFGHIAYWGANHTGLPGQNRKPPHSPTYAYFMTGARVTAGGEVVAVGNLTMGCGHAPTSVRSWEKVKSHYEPPPGAAAAHYDGGYGAVQMADVAAGEDDFGIWVAGVLCEDVSDAQVRKFSSLGLSGDWRTIAGKLHLVAALAVPVPGFPIARQDVLVAAAEVIDSYAVRAGIDSLDSEPFSLVAAGRVRRPPDQERFAALEEAVALLLAERAEMRKQTDLAGLAQIL